MIVTRHPELAQRMKVMRLHGMSRDAFDRFTATVPSWYYEIGAPGFKYNLTNIAAALGLQQLKRIAGFQKRRVELAGALDAGLAGLPLILPPRAPADGQHSWHLYVVRMTDATCCASVMPCARRSWAEGEQSHNPTMTDIQP